MKKENRNCGNNMYPIYPPYQGMMVPPYGMPSPMMQPYDSNQTMISNSSYDQKINNLEQQLNNLTNRVNNLENIINNSNSTLYSNNKYNSSNYQMM